MCKPLCSVWMLLAMGAMLQAQPGIPQQFPFSGTLLHDGAPYDTEKPGNTRADLQVYFFNGAPDAGSVAGDVFRQVFVNQPTNTIGAFALTVNDPAVPAVGDWTAIDWLGGDVWMVVTAEIANQPAEEVARFRVLPMPYAMYAGRTEQVNPAHAVNGQVLKYNGTEFVPGTDSVRVYQAGAGISISGNTIAADDPSPTNELQTLSLSGADLTLSLNGGTVDIAPKIAIVTETRPVNDYGGPFSAGVWVKRMLNTVYPPTNGFVSITQSNQFVLQPGTYYIRASAPAYSVFRHMIRLRNVSTNSDVYGRVSYSPLGTNDDQADAILVAIITVSGTSTNLFELQHRCNTSSSNPVAMGIGLASDLGATGSQLFSIVEIIKLD